VRGALLLVGALGLSILFTALWALAGRRTFVAVVAHATVNTPMFFFEQVVRGVGPSDDRVELPPGRVRGRSDPRGRGRLAMVEVE